MKNSLEDDNIIPWGHNVMDYDFVLAYLHIEKYSNKCKCHQDLAEQNAINLLDET